MMLSLNFRPESLLLSFVIKMLLSYSILIFKEAFGLRLGMGIGSGNGNGGYGNGG